MNQTEFAELCATTRKSQFNYETDARRPDADYLAAIAAAGADVLYILTGQRGQAAPAQPALSPRQAALLDNYDNTNEDGKKIIEATAFAAAKPKAPAVKKGKAA